MFAYILHTYVCTYFDLQTLNFNWYLSPHPSLFNRRENSYWYLQPIGKYNVKTKLCFTGVCFSILKKELVTIKGKSLKLFNFEKV